MAIHDKFRTHTCGQISESMTGKYVKLSGWVESIRDHGGVKFIDLRDIYGVAQIVAHDDNMLAGVSKETVISVTGTIVPRSEGTYNPKIATGTVEVMVDNITILGKSANSLPFEIQSSRNIREDLRLKYRYLDLRNKKNRDNIILRSKIISFLRTRMNELGFLEIQTPILTSSSPEGARDYIIPSRKHRGKFYALPQAPQIFKQILMVSGFDKYFQVAPCFRDEDAKLDRTSGEFYQLDFEMAFATQEDVFDVAEDVLYSTFVSFTDKNVSRPPFVRIPYSQAMALYGTDKPDLRNPLIIRDLSHIFENTDFIPFKGKTVKVINADGCATRPKSFFEQMLSYASLIGMKGLGYLKIDSEMNMLGPINKYLTCEQRREIIEVTEAKTGSVIFFIADDRKTAPKLAGLIRTELGRKLGLIDEDRFEFCFITDFPMYGIDEETGRITFMHNPFSMPQGGPRALNTQKPLDIIAYQFDIVCNGVELSSGAVRNHDPDIMLKAFEICGYTESDLKERFSALYTAFCYGAPPHAGMAPGIDRIVMMLAGEENIREVIAFPLNSLAQDLMTGSPCQVTEQQLRETHIKIRQTGG